MYIVIIAIIILILVIVIMVYGRKNRTQLNSPDLMSESGIYLVVGKKLKPLNKLPKTGSINDIGESLGYADHHGSMSSTFKKVDYIAFKKRTKEPIFVQAKDKSKILTYFDVVNDIRSIDWNFEKKYCGW